MDAVAATFSGAGALELLSVVWGEAAMLCCAAVVFFVLSGRRAAFRRRHKQMVKSRPEADSSERKKSMSPTLAASTAPTSHDLMQAATQPMPASQQKGNGNAALAARMYGSMIKAAGRSHDVARVWTLWKEMVNKKVTPTAITLGCMVEALVSNDCAEDAWLLVQNIWKNESQRPLVNTVIFSTLLKGFARQPDKVVSMYEEMRARGVQCNMITYNTILNAFAQSGAMHRVPELLRDMRQATPPVEPNLVTYSTLIKGFCAAGDLDRAFCLLEEMKRIGKHRPDEVIYSNLLDGCAKESRIHDALRLVDEMRKGGVSPSNYTLSVLVKVLGRCRRLDEAFSMVDSITKEYRFRANIQVYTCLIQACFQNRQPSKALALFDRLLEDGLRPDAKTYTALVRGCLQARQADKAADFAFRAYGSSCAVTLQQVLDRLGVSQDTSKALLLEVGNVRSPASLQTAASRDVPPWVANTRPAAPAATDSAKGGNVWPKAKHLRENSECSTCDTSDTASNKSG